MRLIDADALPKYTGMALSAVDVAMAVENAPTIDPVKHGKWIEHTEPEPWDRHQAWFWTCSECGAVGIDEFRYCPNCGAKMERSEE